jgi:hypothetical protein
MHLEGCGLPAMGIHEGQFLSKSATTIFAFETPRQEMQKGLFTPHIQMPDALLDELSLKASRSVYTRQPPRGEHTKNAGLHVLLRDELHTFLPPWSQCSTIWSGSIRNFFKLFLADPFHGLRSVLYKECHIYGSSSMGNPPRNFSHVHLHQSGGNVPQKVNRQPVFTLIRDEPICLSST